MCSAASQPSQCRAVGLGGVEYDGAEAFYCGGGNSGKVRAVQRPKMRT